ncbi:hypothetical protein PybrP1_009226 [[Pythium] brassicae (nom. inval.)]|nr:hypothetical protein PybrP1_009226 [[Pythium] brassicae (nom. inval.)]
MFCFKGTKRPCPPGTYGATTKLATPQCTAPCPAGSYCPLQTVTPIPCPGGTFGDRVGLQDASCSGFCREGYFCPRGSISGTQNPCGLGVFCPVGSETPTRASEGAFVINGNAAHAKAQLACPVGSFCVGDGGAEFCPGGTFGNASGLTTSECAGRCAGGHFCPRGSSSATPNSCGGAHVYCPEGSALPTPVPCPAGTFGNVFGLAMQDCSGLCREGFYCPEGSITDSAFQCGSSDRFCPTGSPAPTKAAAGYCTVNSGGTALASDAGALTRSAQRIAVPGEFAWRGVCFKCPAGTFGVMEGEVNPRCSGKCARGYFCPPGSTSPLEKECGDADKYCPEAMDAPLSVQVGYYTSKQDEDMCPPGWFRDVSTTTFNNFVDAVTGSSPISVSYGDFSFPLGKCVKCPLGTFKSLPGDDVALCVLCPAFTTRSSLDRRTCECFRRAGGLPVDTPAVLELRFNAATLACEQIPLGRARYAPAEANASIFAKAQQLPCERGFYCQAGVRSPCPGGRYGSSSKETSSTCSGACAAGYYCPLASTNSAMRVCGNANVFCPAGSAVPTPVLPGYYSTRSSLTGSQQLLSGAGVALRYAALHANVNEEVRDAQAQCEAGYFCVGGRKFICPGGRYGDRVGETSPFCQRGYYCPPGSISPTQRECGGSDVICYTGSPLPVAVASGYYSVGGSNATRVHQLVCEPGYFCLGGVKYQCPEGTFGATSGLRDATCSGLCAAGYYCPSYPRLPSVRATQLECGSSTVYCPVGTGNRPMAVRRGFYTVGAGDGSGDAKNTTRTGQTVCPKGFYCRRGVMIRCPDGTYGDDEGLSDPYCTGWCPAGYACPTATADYRLSACPLGTYATKGSAVCIECPSRKDNDAYLSTVLSTFNILSDAQERRPCTTSRECCFFG